MTMRVTNQAMELRYTRLVLSEFSSIFMRVLTLVSESSLYETHLIQWFEALVDLAANKISGHPKIGTR